MRLLICNITRATQGGVEAIVGDLSRGLPVHGIEVVVGTAKGLNRDDPDRYRRAWPELDTIDMDGTGGTRQARIEAVLRTIGRVNPDIALVARVGDVYEAIRQLKARGEGPRLAVTIQAYEPHYLWDARWYRGIIDLCVTSGNLIRQAGIEWSGIAPQRIVSIPGGVELPGVVTEKKSVQQPVRLGYIGRLDPDQKRIMDLIPFVEGIEAQGVDYRLDVVGVGPAEEVLKERFRSRTESGKIVFHGWNTKKNLYGSFYPGIDLLVHFAHTEGITIAPREAMAHGVVPVVSEFIGCRLERQFVDGETALTFPVGDIDRAVANVVRLCRDESLYARLSEGARKSQQGKYSDKGAIQAWAEAFFSCCAMERMNDVPLRPPVPPDGRLERVGLSPWLAQRVRNLVGCKGRVVEGGIDWPTGTYLNREEDDAELQALAKTLDR